MCVSDTNIKYIQTCAPYVAFLPLFVPVNSETELFSETLFLMHVQEVVAFYYVRPADIFDAVTIARHVAGQPLTSLFTTLTTFIIPPT